MGVATWLYIFGPDIPSMRMLISSHVYAAHLFNITHKSWIRHCLIDTRIQPETEIAQLIPLYTANVAKSQKVIDCWENKKLGHRMCNI